MSSWLHSYQAIREHPKTRKLARRVGGLPAAIGHLHCLWWWSMDYARDGDLTRFSPEDIAVAAEWEGDPEELIAHLVECEFLENGDGLKIHDFNEHIGRYLEKAQADAQRKRDARRADGVRTAHGRTADGARSAHVERKKERKKEINSAKSSAESPLPVDNFGSRRAGGNSTTPEVPQVEEHQGLSCWRCHAEIVDGTVVESRKGLRHETCPEVAP